MREAKLQKRSYEEAAGACLMIGLPGPDLDAETGDALAALRPAGVILFRRNLVDPGQTRELLRRVAAAIARPALFAIDQEGGRVSRLAPWIGQTPSASRLAANGDDAVREFATATARALAALGFNLDFAPVVDLSSADAANGIADRAYGDDPETVAHLAGVFLDALQATGVAGCLKHFPGLGPTSVDSHLELPTVDRAVDQLEREDLLPFRRLVSRAACVMVGHGHYPTLHGERPLPATCSKTIVDGWLRRRLGFAGVIVSDDLEMGAVASRDAQGAVAVAALAAGCDLLLYCADLGRAARAVEAVALAARESPALDERVREAGARVLRLACAWPVRGAHDPQHFGECVSGFERFRSIV
jgi:beta-N-acetylhexosaminidase